MRWTVTWGCLKLLVYFLLVSQQTKVDMIVASSVPAAEKSSQWWLLFNGLLLLNGKLDMGLSSDHCGRFTCNNFGCHSSTNQRPVELVWNDLVRRTGRRQKWSQGYSVFFKVVAGRFASLNSVLWRSLWRATRSCCKMQTVDVIKWAQKVIKINLSINEFSVRHGSSMSDDACQYLRI